MNLFERLLSFSYPIRPGGLLSEYRPQREYQAHVDGLRAFAVLSVLFFHLNPNAVPGGFIGVDMFFVVSGYLITGLIVRELNETGTFSFSGFYLRRARRLLPALGVVTSATVVCGVLLFSPSLLREMGGHLLAAVLGVSNFVYWLHADYFDSATFRKPFLHTWSLGVEEQFYFFWPAVLFLVFRSKRKPYQGVFALLLLASLALNWYFSKGVGGRLVEVFPRLENGHSTTFFLTPFRIYEFVIGAMLVSIDSRGWRQEIKDGLVLLSTGLLVFLIFYLNAHRPFTFFGGLAPCLATALILLAGNRSRLEFLFSNRFFLETGRMSYSLYLVHWPLIVFWKYIKIQSLELKDHLLLILGSYFLAHLVFKYIEYPCRHRMVLRSSPVFLGTCFSIMALNFCMALAIGDNGWEWRATTALNLEKAPLSVAYRTEFYGGKGVGIYKYRGGSQQADVVVVGDSHARQYANGLLNLVTSPSHLSLVVAAGVSCFHLPGFSRPFNKRDFDHACPEAYQKAKHFIADAKKPPLVVMAHSWRRQMERGYLLEKGENGRTISIHDIFAGIQSFKKDIGQSELVLLGEVPTAKGVDPFDLLTRPNIIPFWKMEPLKYFSSVPHRRGKDLNLELRRMLAQEKGIYFLDPYEALCTQSKCTNVDPQGHLLYSDGSHLSTYGSNTVIKYFLPMFEQRLLQRSKERLAKAGKVATSSALSPRRRPSNSDPDRR